MPRHVHNCFATPIITDTVSDGAKLNERLSRLILERRNSIGGLRRSNRSGWHSDTELLRWAADDVRPIIAQIVQMADENSQDLQARPGQRRGWLLEAWANVSGTGAANASHSHGGSYWSAVYYVQIGDGEGGDIVFEDPRSPMIEMHAPFLRFRDAGGEGLYSITPAESQILLFPSWLKHSVTPWLGNTPRISIAVNLTAPPLRS